MDFRIYVLIFVILSQILGVLFLSELHKHKPIQGSANAEPFFFYSNSSLHIFNLQFGFKYF
jgi:hypothetical protein